MGGIGGSGNGEISFCGFHQPPCVRCRNVSTKSIRVSHVGLNKQCGLQRALIDAFAMVGMWV